jgi:TolB-like protein/Tfp pilus assembly protein PilF
VSLIAELKRRNVFKAGAAYLALGWVVTQVTAAVVPALNLPDSLNAIVVWIGMIGFPFVVMFSWIYELTPEGLKRESEVDRSRSITRETGRKLDFVIIVLLVAAITVTVLDRLLPGPVVPATATAALDNAAASAAAAGPARARSVEAAPATGHGQGPLLQEEQAPDEKSIAVLPFVNMSEDASNEFFADGISEELLNLLAKIPELKVAARTSSFSYKGKDTRIATIGEELGVAHVLEGSVRKSGNTVRITAQLVRSVDGYHLWSETWDRTLEDIFAVQDEIAGAVVRQLEVTLLGEVPKAKAVDPEAYALLLHARELGRRHTAEGYEQSNALYQQALAIDPDAAAAWQGLASNYIRQTSNSLLPVNEGVRLAREAANRALAVDPGFALAHAGLGNISGAFDGDLAAAARHLQQALALEPTNTDILVEASRLALSLGRPDTTIELAGYVVARDPVNPFGYVALLLAYMQAGRFDEAIASGRTALRLAPGRISTHSAIAVMLMLKGQLDAALAEANQESSASWRLFALSMIHHSLGRQADSDAALAELLQHHEQDASYNIAYVLAWRGEVDRAFEWLDKAVGYRDPGLSQIVGERLFANLQDDPRWLPFLRKIGRAPEQLAAIPFEVKLPP